MKVEIKGDKLVIELPLNKKGVPSKSGKTLVVATSSGNQKTGVKIGEREIIVGVNAYIGKEDE